MRTLLKYILILTAFIAISCSTRLYKTSSNYVLNISDQKTFNLSDFDIYVYNLCEKYANNVNPIERFCNCPDNFYDVAKNQSIKKIEELYFLVHRSEDLVVYLTTQSHQFISNKQKGFLNDRTKFENKINLNEIEYAYVGRIDRTKQTFRFQHNGSDKDIILKYNSAEWPNALNIKSANIATVENNYSISGPIDMTTIFQNELVYTKYNYEVIYFNKEQALKADRLSLLNKNEKLNLIFNFSNSNEHIYKMSSSRLRYHLPYKDIR